MKHYLTTLLILLTIGFLNAQIEFHGQIIDYATKQPVEGASLTEHFTTNGTSSDSLGFFTLITKDKSPLLIASHVSYVAGEFQANRKNRERIVIQLKKANYMIGELNFKSDSFESILSNLDCDSAEFKEILTDPRFTVIESFFEYPGGWNCLDYLFMTNLQPSITSKTIKTFGELDINFNIGPNGYPSDITVSKEISDNLSKVLENTFSAMPRWKPATQNGKNITVNITYRLIYNE